MADKTATVIGKDQSVIPVKYVDAADGTWNRRIRSIAGGAGSDKFATVIGINQDPITIRYTDQLDGTFAERIDLVGGAGSQDLLFTPDATYDIGKSGATRPRDIFTSRNMTVGGQILAKDGTAGSPSYSFASQTDLGFFRESATNIRVVIAGVGKSQFGAANLDLNSSSRLGWNSTADLSTGAIDLSLYRDASNTLALRNGASAQTLNLYNTYTDASNYSRLGISAGANMAIETQNLGTGGAVNLIIGAGAGGGLFLESAGSLRWQLNTGGHFIAQTDNSYDIGASGATRPRSIYVGTSFLAPAGSVGAPSISFAGDTNTGFYSTGSDSILISMNGVASGSFASSVGGTFTIPAISANGYVFLGNNVSGGGVQIATGNLSFGANDLILARDAANILALRNGVNAQQFNLYNTYTDGSNYERFGFTWTTNQFQALIAVAGTGNTARSMLIGTGEGSGKLSIRTGGITSWSFNGSGYLICEADNSYDIGASGANRPRSVYVGTNVFIGNNELIGVAAVGTSGAKVLGIGTGTEPSTSPADMVQLYSVDISAGNASLGLRTEIAAAVDAALVSTHSLTVRINGANYKIPLVSA